MENALLPGPDQTGPVSGRLKRTVGVQGAPSLTSWLLPLMLLISSLIVVMSEAATVVPEQRDNTPAQRRTAPIHAGYITPIPTPEGLSPAEVSLGRRLFNEVRLSGDQSTSCASCHDLKSGGDDGLVRSVGIDGEVGEVNAPTVFNSGLNFAQFWDGRAATLEEQVDGPLLNPKEMGSSWALVLGRLGQDAAYLKQFESVYEDGLTAANVRRAIATFERSLNTVNSRFDRYLRGESNAITAHEKKGYELFKSYGCVTCHQGSNVGGNLFQPLGLIGDYFADRGDQSRADLGRFNVTGDDQDRHYFKVPSLRLVVLTAPYMHDGSAKTLHDAIDLMGKYQLGREHIPDDDAELIVEFLHTLVGEYQGRMLDE